MDYSKLLASIGQAKAPKRTKAWKTIVGDPVAFRNWFKDLPPTEEQKIEASMPQLFATLNAAGCRVTASRADGPSLAIEYPEVEETEPLAYIYPE